MVFFPVYSEVTLVTGLLPAEIISLLEQASIPQYISISLESLWFYAFYSFQNHHKYAAQVLFLFHDYISHLQISIFCTSTVHANCVCLSLHFCFFPKSPTKFPISVYITRLHVNTYCSINIKGRGERERENVDERSVLPVLC